MTNEKMTIGILALQGAFVEHRQIMGKLGAEVILIRSLADVQNKRIDGVILPGGESTTMTKMMKKTGLDEWLVKQAKAGLPVFGTCAGVILLANLGLIDIEVKRNAYGSHLDSFETEIEWFRSGKTCLTTDEKKPFPAIFIRAPKITSVGKTVKILAKHDNIPVFVQQNNVIATSFHPELTDSIDIHSLFLAHIKKH